MASARARHLEVLLCVAELGTVRNAAEALHITQPAVTKIVADLELLLGVPLFLRHSRGMQPSAVCAQILPAVRRVVVGFRDIAEQTAQLGYRSKSVARVLASGSAIPGFLVQILPGFTQQFADMLIQIREIESSEAVPMLMRKEADIALCTAPAVIPDGWRFESLVPDEFVVLAAPDHPLAIQKRVTAKQLAGYEWMVTPVETGSNDAFERLFIDGPKPALCQISARVPEILWAMLASMQLLAIAPASTTRQLVGAGQLCVIDCAENLPGRDIGTLLPAEVSEAAERFHDFCLRHSRNSKTR